MRETTAIALPGLITSRVSARPLVAEMAMHTDTAGVCPGALCMQAYDAHAQAACTRWLQELPVGVHAEVRRLAEDASELAATRWRCWCEDTEAAPQDGDADDAPARHAASVIGPVGIEDVELPHSVCKFSPLRLQQLLTRVADKCAAQGPVEKFQTQQLWGDLHRLEDLSCKDASHEWLWAVHRHKAQQLEPDEYVEAVRLCLGCGGPEEPALCNNYGVAVLTCNGEHGLLCVRGESTRGHNATRDELHNIAFH